MQHTNHTLSDRVENRLFIPHESSPFTNKGDTTCNAHRIDHEREEHVCLSSSSFTALLPKRSSAATCFKRPISTPRGAPPQRHPRHPRQHNDTHSTPKVLHSGTTTHNALHIHILDRLRPAHDHSPNGADTRGRQRRSRRVHQRRSGVRPIARPPQWHLDCRPRGERARTRRGVHPADHCGQAVDTPAFATADYKPVCANGEEDGEEGAQGAGHDGGQFAAGGRRARFS